MRAVFFHARQFRFNPPGGINTFNFGDLLDARIHVHFADAISIDRLAGASTHVGKLFEQRRRSAAQHAGARCYSLQHPHYVIQHDFRIHDEGMGCGDIHDLYAGRITDTSCAGFFKQEDTVIQSHTQR